MTSNFGFGRSSHFIIFDEMWNVAMGQRPYIRYHADDRPKHEPKRTVHAERVGSPELTDGVLRPTQVLWTWPMILDRLEPFQARYAVLHQPTFTDWGQLDDCTSCDYPWPCPDAQEILGYFGLTHRDLDYRPEDVRARADLVQGTRLRSAQAPR